jgi:hypothetical protein
MIQKGERLVLMLLEPGHVGIRDETIPCLAGFDDELLLLRRRWAGDLLRLLREKERRSQASRQEKGDSPVVFHNQPPSK